MGHLQGASEVGAEGTTEVASELPICSEEWKHTYASGAKALRFASQRSISWCIQSFSPLVREGMISQGKGCGETRRTLFRDGDEISFYCVFYSMVVQRVHPKVATRDFAIRVISRRGFHFPGPSILYLSW